MSTISNTYFDGANYRLFLRLTKDGETETVESYSDNALELNNFALATINDRAPLIAVGWIEDERDQAHNVYEYDDQGRISDKRAAATLKTHLQRAGLSAAIQERAYDTVLIVKDKHSPEMKAVIEVRHGVAQTLSVAMKHSRRLKTNGVGEHTGETRGHGYDWRYVTVGVSRNRTPLDVLAPYIGGDERRTNLFSGVVTNAFVAAHERSVVLAQAREYRRQAISMRDAATNGADYLSSSALAELLNGADKAQRLATDALAIYDLPANHLGTFGG